MKIELIQPFINAADAVLAETLQGTVKVRDVSMQEEVYRRRGLAACVAISGDIEGRVIFDLDREAVLAVARALTSEETEPSDEFAGETVCELANMVVGNAITLLNNQGFRFKVYPPELHTAENGYAGSSKSEALVMLFETASGEVHMNIALDYSRQRAVAEVVG